MLRPSISSRSYRRLAAGLVCLLLAVFAAHAQPQPRPQAETQPSRNIIGLLVLPEIFGGEVCVPFKAADVLVHASPGGPRTGVLRVKNPWRRQGAMRCDELEADYLPDGQAADLLPVREYGYEQKAALVLEVQPGWYRVALSQSHSGWVAVGSGRRFLGLSILFGERPLSPPVGWVGELYDTPGGPLIERLESPNQPSFRMIRILQHQGVWWMRVEFPVAGPCGDTAPGPLRQRWLRLHLDDGQPALWYSSRGC